MIIWKVLALALEKKASDVIFTSNAKPQLKINWDIFPVDDFEVLSIDELNNEIVWMMTKEQNNEFQKNFEVDFAVNLKWFSRFRVNVFKQRKSYWAVFRPIMSDLPDFHDLNLPSTIMEFTKKRNWLVLVTWSVWSWKSTTLASLIDNINKESQKHIITVEDPIEYIHGNKKSIIEQREVWEDTLTYENGLKYSLRQAPDVIMIWEMRDLETFRLALRAAETWNLVFATLHTSWAARTVARVIDMFPPEEKEQIKAQLSESLIWVVWQNLIKKKDWSWMIPAVEILVNSTSVSNMIRKGILHQINWVIETSKAEGMIPMEKSLEALLQWKVITENTFNSYNRSNEL